MLFRKSIPSDVLPNFGDTLGIKSKFAMLSNMCVPTVHTNKIRADLAPTKAYFIQENAVTLPFHSPFSSKTLVGLPQASYLARIALQETRILISVADLENEDIFDREFYYVCIGSGPWHFK